MVPLSGIGLSGISGVFDVNVPLCTSAGNLSVKGLRWGPDKMVVLRVLICCLEICFFVLRCAPARMDFGRSETSVLRRQVGVLRCAPKKMRESACQDGTC